MGRARGFDEGAVLEQALACFWRHGYEACGVRELTDATGLKPQSLYNAFGSKRGLFLAALRRYREHVRQGSSIMLFARLDQDERAFWFLGPAKYVSHEGERPMSIRWRLAHELPGDLFAQFAAAVA